MLMGAGMRAKFAAMKRVAEALRRVFRGRRYYLLMDGMHSCAYVPRGTYRKLMRLLYESLERDPRAENSLRFLWTRRGGEWLLLVNPSKDVVLMTCTHGLTRDVKGRVLVPCPYMQQMYAWQGVAPEWCGRMEVRFVEPCVEAAGELIIHNA